MNIKETAEIIYTLHSAYPADRKATEQDLAARIDTFSVTFADFDITIVRRSVSMWIMTQKYMPTVQELLQSCCLLSKIGAANFISDTDPEPLLSEEESAEIENLIDWVWEDFS